MKMIKENKYSVSHYWEAFPSATRVRMKWIRSVVPFTSTTPSIIVFICVHLFQHWRLKTKRYKLYFVWKKNIGFECYEPLHSAPQLTVTIIFTYIIYLYVFITVKTALQLNRLSRTVQTAVTIQRHKLKKNYTSSKPTY